MIHHFLNSIGIIGSSDGPTAVFISAGNWENVQEALNIMGKGMLGIFVVIGILAAVMGLLTRLGRSK